MPTPRSQSPQFRGIGRDVQDKPDRRIDQDTAQTTTDTLCGFEMNPRDTPVSHFEVSQSDGEIALQYFLEVSCNKNGRSPHIIWITLSPRPSV